MYRSPIQWTKKSCQQSAERSSTKKAPAHSRIRNTKRNAKGAITVLTHTDATAEMVLL